MQESSAGLARVGRGRAGEVSENASVAGKVDRGKMFVCYSFLGISEKTVLIT